MYLIRSSQVIKLTNGSGNLVTMMVGWSLVEWLCQYDGICQLRCPLNQAGISLRLSNNWSACPCLETRCYQMAFNPSMNQTPERDQHSLWPSNAFALKFSRLMRASSMVRRWRLRKGLVSLWKTPIQQYYRSWPLGCSWASFRSWCRSLYGFLVGATRMPCCLSFCRERHLDHPSEQFFIGEKGERGHQVVVPLNSNWTGIPDTLNRSLHPNYSALKQANTELFLQWNTAHYIQWLPWGIVGRHHADLASLDGTSKLQGGSRTPSLSGKWSNFLCQASPSDWTLDWRKVPTWLFQLFLDVLAGISLFVDEGTETEMPSMSCWNTWTVTTLVSGLEAKPGESEDEKFVS